MTTKGAALGLIGLGVMGRNLALNLADHGYGVAGLDRDAAAAEKLVQASRDAAAPAHGVSDHRSLLAALERPRAILMLIPAGAAIDAEIDALLPLLAPGDILVDGGNSHYRDTMRRVARLKQSGLHFAGLGVSGGEQGARNGPSLMGGGDAEAYRALGPMLEAIAARANGRPCYAHVGPDGAGHFVKTLHNGIEYAVMQLLAESYFVANRLLGLSPARIQAMFAGWADGWQSSFLLEATTAILGAADLESGKPMLDVIVDRASQKGTGQWSAAAALEFGIPAPTIAEAVHARCISGLRAERLQLERQLGSPLRPIAHDTERLADALGPALLCGMIAAYAQGFAVIAAASAELGWNVDLSRLAQIWQGGCIIRARLLEPIDAGYRAQPDMPNLLATPEIAALLQSNLQGLRQVASVGLTQGAPLPAHASALTYLDAARTGRIWANMIEAQRDYFGAHGFERLDRPGKHHHSWQARR